MLRVRDERRLLIIVWLKISKRRSLLSSKSIKRSFLLSLNKLLMAFTICLNKQSRYSLTSSLKILKTPLTSCFTKSGTRETSSILSKQHWRITLKTLSDTLENLILEDWYPSLPTDPTGFEMLGTNCQHLRRTTLNQNSFSGQQHCWETNRWYSNTLLSSLENIITRFFGRFCRTNVVESSLQILLDIKDLIDA